MAKKVLRSNSTFLIEGNRGDNPKLFGRETTDGRVNLYFEVYLGKDESMSESGRIYKKNLRRNEKLDLFLWQAPRTPEERRQNKETLDLAKRLRFERSQELLEANEGYRLKKNREIDFLEWMWSYYEAYTKADKRQIKRAYVCFVDYLTDPNGALTPIPDGTEGKLNLKRAYALKLRPQQLTKEMVIKFTDYLQNRYRGEGPHTVYARFKKIIKAAVEADVLYKNPCTGVSIKVDNGSLKKDVLSIDEIKQLVATHYYGENPEIRRAFIFCLYCGLRFCDVKDLTFANVDFSNGLLQFEQAKTKGHSSASGVVIPLNENLLNLIGKGARDEHIFRLPSHTMCLKALRHWTKHAGIDKHITWHCARHSFAVNILNNGANIKTVASLLGHSGLKHTEKYTRAVDSLKEAAINSLPKLDF